MPVATSVPITGLVSSSRDLPEEAPHDEMRALIGGEDRRRAMACSGDGALWVSDIFISHSSVDRSTAMQVLDRLRDRGYRSLFLDSDPEAGLKAGSFWERDLYRKLKLAGAVVVLCSPESMASRWCFAEITQAKALGKAIFPIVIRPCQVVDTLTDRQVIDLVGGGEDDGFARLFEGLRVAGLDPADSFDWNPSRPPFPGLMYFDSADAGIYFGREDEIRQGIETLTQMRRQREPRLLVLVGSSGSGKSSLVRAGILPRLAKDRSRWAIVPPFRPTTNPLGELARALSMAFPEGPSRPDWKVLRDRLKNDPPSAEATPALAEIADDLAMAVGEREASVLLVVDQAEELFPSVDPGAASDFLATLQRTMSRSGGRVFAILTLRSDFLGSFQNHPSLRGLPFANVPLGLLPVDRFAQVIEGPAARAQITLEPGLVHAMMSDAKTSDALPLLAFTLEQMNKRCKNEAGFTLAVYRDELGRMDGVVGRVVQEIKDAAAWTPEIEPELRRAFLKLVRVNEEGQYTRQQARWAHLPEKAAPVLEKFVQARLLTSNGDVVEVAHESLFRVWSELAAWLDEGRELMLWKKSIVDEVKDWTAHDRAPDWLLSGARVAEARRWLDRQPDDFPDEEREFLEAGIAAEDARRDREIAQNRRLRRLTRFLVAFLGITIGLGGLAGWAYFVAKHSREELEKTTGDLTTVKSDLITKKEEAAKARAATHRANLGTQLEQDGVEASRLFQDDQIEGILLAMQAGRGLQSLSRSDISFANDLESLPTISPITALIDGLPSLRIRNHLDQFEDLWLRVGFSPDGSVLAAAPQRDAHLIKLFNATSGRPIGVISSEHQGLLNLCFSPNSEILATSGLNSVKLWSTEDGRELKALTKDVGYIYCVQFSPDGRIVAVDHSNQARFWEAGTGKELAPLSGEVGPVKQVQFSPDGERVVTTGMFKEIIVWEVKNRHEIQRWSHPGDQTRASQWYPDGKAIFTLGSSGRLTAWKFGVDVGEVLAKGEKMEQFIVAPDGKFLACLANKNNSLVILSLPDGRELARLPGGASVAVSSDSRSLVVSAFDGTISGYRGSDWRPVFKVKVHEGPSEVRFQPGGKQFASGGSDGLLKVWEFAPPSCWIAIPDALRDLIQTRDGALEFAGLQISPGSRFLKSITKSGDFILWEVDTGRKIGPLSVGFIPKRVEFLDHDRYLAATTDSDITTYWELEEGKRLGTRPLGIEPGSGAAFGPAPIQVVDGQDRMIIKDLASGRTIASLPKLIDFLAYDFMISPNERVAALSRISSAKVKLWDIKANHEIKTLQDIGYVCFSPNGELLASCDYYGKTLKLWQASTGRLIGSFQDMPELMGMSFTPDGNTLIGWGKSGTLIFLPTRLEKWLQVACDWLAPYFALHPERNRFTVSLPDGRSETRPLTGPGK